MKKIIYLFICTIILSCNVSPKEESEWGIFEISKATYKGKPVVGSIDQFKEILKNPISKIDSCLRISIYPHGGPYWRYHCITPEKEPNLTYAIIEEVIFIRNVKFATSEAKIISPKLTLSNKTTLEDIKEVIPKSYKTLNQYGSLLIPEGHEWVQINDDLSSKRRNAPNYIQLWFKDNRLTNFTYYWTPEMTDDQILENNKFRKKNEY